MSDENPKSEEIEQNLKWFHTYVDVLENYSISKPPQAGVSYNCPCCGYKTLDERGGFDICSVCFWEDDGQDDHDAHIVRGGPNGALSLSQARANFQNFGACEERFIKNVRKPLPEEK